MFVEPSVLNLPQFDMVKTPLLLLSSRQGIGRNDYASLIGKVSCLLINIIATLAIYAYR